jgi:cell fate (sporulation/competence/biofilm development) regulator YlbF (YheA/YmcA/DUF963 family)
MELVHALADKIKDSKEYLSYCEAQRILYEDKRNTQKLADYRKMQLRLHIGQISGEEFHHSIEELENICYDLFCDEIIANYLYAEGRFSRLLSDIQMALGGELDIWLEMGPDEGEGGVLLN